MVQTSMIMVEELGVALIFVRWSLDERETRWFVWHGILFEEPNPTSIDQTANNAWCARFCVV